MSRTRKDYPLKPGSSTSQLLSVMNSDPQRKWTRKELFKALSGGEDPVSMHAISDAAKTLMKRGLITRVKRGVFRLFSLDGVAKGKRGGKRRKYTRAKTTSSKRSLRAVVVPVDDVEAVNEALRQMEKSNGNPGLGPGAQSLQKLDPPASVADIINPHLVEAYNQLYSTAGLRLETIRFSYTDGALQVHPVPQSIVVSYVKEEEFPL